jgi:methionyl-tRNA formyltransferase
MATELGLELLRPERCRDPQFVHQVKAMSPDVLVVAAYGQILPVELLEAAPNGGINIHASLLPRWRGAAPIQRAIEAGDTVSGVTIMQMDAGMDTGGILLQRETPIGADETAGELEERLAAIGSKLIVEALDRLPLPASPQDDALATKARKLKKEEGLLNWSLPAAQLYNRFRAFCPRPGVHTHFGGRLVKVVAAEIGGAAGEPGAVIAVSKNGIEVACGDGSLVLETLQPEGKPKMPGAAFANGYRVVPGSRFG